LGEGYWTPLRFVDKNGTAPQNMKLGRNGKRRMARIFISHSSRDNDAADRMKAWLASQGFENGSGPV